MKKVTLFILLVSLLLPISLSAQSVKLGGQKVKIAISGAEPTYLTTLASEDSGAPTNLVVSNIEPYAAQVSWEGKIMATTCAIVRLTLLVWLWLL